ncbi:glycosyltransferase [Echinicola jeungdonensis]|uniref:Glycosyltransferase n=1 Tax=Echinicola jeungdonensis TaxID=709343 RepID=A0ABV5J5E8_9BACT|nr:glycosyltransferase [Echinicola jeungdonensis]MDN3668186.1 glycosyltransferase [Echinicola jeungdonensis]
MISLISIFLVFLLLIQDLLLWILLKYHFQDYSKPIEEGSWPRISVLIPARNEAQYLPQCLKALEKLRYPPEKIEFIIGNDESTDQTEAIIKAWAGKEHNRVYVNVSPQKGNLMNGKANALVQLIQVAEGELFLFTDADCEVNPEWAREMVRAFTPEKGMVIGISRVKAKSFWERWQGMDWWLTLSMVKVASDLGQSLTGVGNNMLVSKEAYNSVGGFEALPFSVTEDFELGRAIWAKGYRPVHQVSLLSLALTKAENNVLDLLRQRKRWTQGAMGLPWFWKMALVMQLLFFPAIIYLVFQNFTFGLLLWAIKIFLQMNLMQYYAQKTKTRLPFIPLLFFEVYYAVISWSTIVYYFWPSKIKWKERNY